jgi:hypothetical protein
MHSDWVLYSEGSNGELAWEGKANSLEHHICHQSPAPVASAGL